MLNSLPLDDEETDDNPFAFLKLCTLTAETIAFLSDHLKKWCWIDEYEYSHVILQCLAECQQWEALEALAKHDWRTQYATNMGMNVMNISSVEEDDIRTITTIISDHLFDHDHAIELQKLERWNALSA